jgi:hypothetical protein
MDMVVGESRKALRFWRLGATAGVVLVGANGSNALAQTAPANVTQITLSADLEHDSNIGRTSPLLAALQNVEQSDEMLTLGAGLDLARPLGRNTLSVNAFAGYDFHRRNTRLNRERLSLSGAAGIEAGPCTINLQPDIERRQSNLNEIAVLGIPGIESVRNVQTTQSYRGELLCGRYAGFRPLVSYQREWGDNSNVFRKTQDYRSERFGFGLSYSNPVMGNYHLSVERENLQYPHRLVPGIVALPGYQLDEVVLSGSRGIGAVLVAEASVGYSKLKPRNNLQTVGYSGITWNLAATLTPTPALRAKLAFSQSVKPSLGVDALFNRDRNYSLDVSYYLSSRTSIGAGYSRSDHRFGGARSITGPLLSTDHLDRFSARVGFTPSRRLSLTLEGGREQRNANGTFYDYKNTYVALSTRFRLGTP